MADLVGEPSRRRSPANSRPSIVLPEPTAPSQVRRWSATVTESSFSWTTGGASDWSTAESRCSRSEASRLASEMEMVTAAYVLRTAYSNEYVEPPSETKLIGEPVQLMVAIVPGEGGP